MFRLPSFAQFVSEKVDPKAFKPGYEKTKELPNGFTLTATPGTVNLGQKDSEFFRIEVSKGKARVGWVNFMRFDDYDGKGDDVLQAFDLHISKDYRRKGLATELYKFARELGNSIVPSTLQTSGGKAFWSVKDHSK